MNRILRGAVLLAALALVGACATEPEGSQGGDPDKLIAEPGSIFLVQGDSSEVLLRLLDQQGTSLNSPVSIANVGTGIAVSVDSLYRPVFGPDGSLTANTANTELRVVVSASGLAATSFTATAGGETVEVPVTVLPISLEATLSNPTPNIGEVVTVTAPEGFTFNPGSSASFAAGDDPQIVGVSGDGTTLSIIPKPGSSGVITVTDVTPAYAPTLQIPLALSSQLALTSVSLYSSDDPATAPSITAPAIGDTVTIFDHSVAVDQFTHIEITEDNTVLDITVDWTGGADVDFWLCDALCTNPGTPGGFGAATGSHPEHLEVTFPTAGTYTIQLNLYSGAAPTYQSIQLIRLAPDDTP